MADSLFHLKLTEEIGQEMADVVAPLILGSCVDFAEYKERCGIIAGLKLALAASEKINIDIHGDSRR